MAEAHTVRPRPTGHVRGSWQERFGTQRLDVTADPGRNDPDSEFIVLLERRWGPQLTDTRRQDFQLSRAGATELRDALTAALEWQPPTDA